MKAECRFMTELNADADHGSMDLEHTRMAECSENIIYGIINFKCSAFTGFLSGSRDLLVRCADHGSSPADPLSWWLTTIANFHY